MPYIVIARDLTGILTMDKAIRKDVDVPVIGESSTQAEIYPHCNENCSFRIVAMLTR